MSSFVSLAEKLPFINQAWYRAELPPPYEPNARRHPLSDLVRSSFISHSPVESIHKEKMNEGITLIQMATDMHASNKQVSIDLYMMGLDKLLSSLPVDSDPMLKKSLEQKLVEFKRRAGLVLLDAEEKTSLSEQQKALGGLSELVIHAAVLSAIAVKKSPLPGIASTLFGWTKTSLVKIDQICSIRERTSNIAQLGLAKAIELDQHTQAHQWVAQLFYLGSTAILKAGIAYAEAE